MKFILRNVRLSFPSLFKAKTVTPGSEPKYAASFLLDKKDDAAQIDALRSAVRQVALGQWPNKIPAGVKYCVHEGSEKEYDGYGEHNIYVSTSATIKPGVVDRRNQPLSLEDGRPYAGCYVNAVIRLWAMDNQFGKRINAQLCGVQFSRDGEAFGDKPFDATQEFEPLDKEDSGFADETGATRSFDPNEPDDNSIPF